MTDLFWALYWIDVLSGLTGSLLGLTCMIALICVLPQVPKWVDGAKYNWPAKRLAACIVVIWIAVVLIPSKSTMYVMLGVKTTENIMASETGKKLQQIVDGELDSLLKKYSKRD